ncbi:glycosyltransferase [Actinomycetospora atypica]|uniref:Glycosyltransferase n=1 Tax=Actinomycetospora atypica TaxID=1290095 RepID=A0ABV9YHS0_9PSEU
MEAREVRGADSYGYQTLREFYEVTFSRDLPREPWAVTAHRALRKVLGFDLAHLWTNRMQLRRSDVVVTHTEFEFIGVLVLLRLFRDRRRKVLCQAVWLWDRWPYLLPLQRLAYRHLMNRALVLTTHSHENVVVCRDVVPSVPAVVVPFGIQPLPPIAVAVDHADHARPRVLSAGNDKDRDWDVLARAAARTPLDLRVRSSSRVARASLDEVDASVRPSIDVDEFLDDLSWCDVVVVPLSSNRHASGVTVALEALSVGRPVVVADTGGLRDYFGDAVQYYDVGDAASLVASIRAALVAGPSVVGRHCPHAHLKSRGLRSEDYARRHMVLIESLLSGRGVPAQVSEFVPPCISTVER